MSIADLLLPLDDTSGIPLYRQVYAGLRDAILEGRLPPGARIPSSRRLAEYLAVSRRTVLVAFDILLDPGDQAWLEDQEQLETEVCIPLL